MLSWNSFVLIVLPPTRFNKAKLPSQYLSRIWISNVYFHQSMRRMFSNEVPDKIGVIVEYIYQSLCSVCFSVINVKVLQETAS